MKVAIISTIMEGPSGGGNQFLKALKAYFVSKNMYSESLREADLILVNSHHWLSSFPKIIFARCFLRKKIVHRVDGPLSLTRGEKSLKLDRLISRFNEGFCSATVYQSEWSRRRCIECGFSEGGARATIINGVDDSIFFPSKNVEQDDKVKIIISSWSSNERKGFKLYKYLDRTLNFERFQVTFVGNSSVDFESVKQIGPLDSAELSTQLRSHHIFLTGSEDDPCSNALIEAMSSGLLPVARRSGGHPEIVGAQGFLFDTHEQAIESIEHAALAYKNRAEVRGRSIGVAGAEYESFFYELHSSSDRPVFLSGVQFIPEMMIRIGLFYFRSFLHAKKGK